MPTTWSSAAATPSSCPSCPKDCAVGGNENAYFGGLRMWEDTADAKTSSLGVFPKTEPPAEDVRSASG